MAALDLHAKTIRHPMRKSTKLILLAALSMLLSFSAFAEPAGMVQSAEGTVVVIKADGKRRIVSPGSNLDQGDSLHTEKGSTAKLRFSDGSEMVVRPSSAVVIQDYHYQATAPEKDAFVVGLLRGALRQLTGFIGKRGNQDAYKLRSGTATIGIRGTDFTARVCAGTECQDGKPEKSRLAASSPVIAKVAEIKGRASALPRNGLRRELAIGAAIYQDDTLETDVDAYVALLFTDQSRVVLPGDSSFRVSSYSHVPSQPEKGNMFFDLLKGSFRMVTGLIGKASPRKVNISAGTATIGIRGTSFDLACVPANIPNPEGFGGGGGGTSCSGGGLYTATRDGAISVTTADGNVSVFEAGQTSYLAGPNQAPVLIKFSPEFLRTLPGPLPERINLDIQGLFGIDPSTLGETGLYVTVVDGKVVIAQADRELLLETGESGFAPGTGLPPQRLINPPNFLIQDKSQTQQNIGFRSCRM